MEYMSEEGYNRLVAELNELVNVELPRVKEALSEARDKGDLSENFEYHAARREHGKLLGRIRFKQRVLEHARVLERKDVNTDTIMLLSKVELTNTANQMHMSYTLVSPHEADLRSGRISIKSPIGQALLGRKCGETVDVSVPAGTLHLHIDDISL